MTTWIDCPDATRNQIATFRRGVEEIASTNLVGIYLHGSLAMGCFNPARSDLDILVITQSGLTVERKRDLAQHLLQVSNAPHPIEVSFLNLRQLHTWTYPTPFDLHYSEDWRAQTEAQLQEGTWRQWNETVRTDADLAAHITILRSRGICLTGEPIAEVFPIVPEEHYRASIVGDFDDACDHIAENPVYGVLNACRVYAFLCDRKICSKEEGGVWGLTVLPDPFRAIVAQALAAYCGAADPLSFSDNDLTGFMEEMADRISRPGTKNVPG